MDSELIRVWQLINELSEQLAQNQKLASTITLQSGELKAQASEANSGFALNRVNTNISQETFESELERTNARIIIENQTLLHENKQLSVLLKEHEDTMANIMAKFRNHSLAAQNHEKTLIRHYETLLHSRANQNYTMDLATSTHITRSLARLSHYLRALLRSMAGEEPENDIIIAFESEHEIRLIDPSELQTLLDALEGRTEENYPGTEARGDWVVEREHEIARLERENEELRRSLGIDATSIAERGITVELDQFEPGRYSTFFAARRMGGHSQQNSGDGMGGRPYWEQHAVNVQQQQHMQQLQQGGLQRPMELQPGMRGGMTARRPGIFGGAPRGGAMSGLGRGIPTGPPTTGGPMYAGQLGPQTTDRPWPLQIGPSIDTGR
ncbi:hypothetical protein BDN72DRAFT_818754 [Pluteus cervinus]|uniref:Uncharacterized protein n=1 Tax=Pluteus cervinus TaxID=181527 RepID=A0ACD3AWQ5_9AGAR|nr:hypothetical protein BDN72DRAFT_818754 [Pluteus cervinus]